MNQVLYIVGPTATGKSALAFELAKQIPSVIISVDSRQIYAEMKVGTGAQIPADFSQTSTKYIYEQLPLMAYSNGSTTLHFVHSISARHAWNVQSSTTLGWQIIQDAWNSNLLPIVVGGTGLYAKSLDIPPESLQVPMNDEQRLVLERKTTQALQQTLIQLNPEKFRSMNQSDKANARRLIRAIEVAQYLAQNPHTAFQPPAHQSLWINLQATIPELQPKIKESIETRIQTGMLVEVQTLQDLGLTTLPHVSNATGYSESIQYLQHNDETLWKTAWLNSELQYVKRQITWFNKQPHLESYAAFNTNTPKKVAQRVRSWYNLQ